MFKYLKKLMYKKVNIEDSKTYTDVNGMPCDILANWYPLCKGQIVTYEDHASKLIGRVLDPEKGTIEQWHGRGGWVWTGYSTRRARLANLEEITKSSIPLSELTDDIAREIESDRHLRKALFKNSVSDL